MGLFISSYNFKGIYMSLYIYICIYLSVLTLYLCHRKKTNDNYSSFPSCPGHGYSHGKNKDKDMAPQTYLILLNHYTCPIPV